MSGKGVWVMHIILLFVIQPWVTLCNGVIKLDMGFLSWHDLKTQHVLLDVDLLAHSTDEKIVTLSCGNVLVCGHPDSEEDVQSEHNRSVDGTL